MFNIFKKTKVKFADDDPGVVGELPTELPEKPIDPVWIKIKESLEKDEWSLGGEHITGLHRRYELIRVKDELKLSYLNRFVFLGDRSREYSSYCVLFPNETVNIHSGDSHIVNFVKPSFSKIYHKLKAEIDRKKEEQKNETLRKFGLKD